MDEITIAYAIDPGVAAPNECKASTTYKGGAIDAYGGTWDEAKQNCVGRCKQLKSLGEPPASETIDLDPPAA